jgi:MYXO-CTERM domain-containing protein
MYAACPWPITDAGAGVDASAPGGGSLDGGAANAGDGSAPGLTPSTAGGGVQCGARPGARGAGDMLLAAVVALGAALRRRRRAG